MFRICSGLLGGLLIYVISIIVLRTKLNIRIEEPTRGFDLTIYILTGILILVITLGLLMPVLNQHYEWME